MKVIMSYPTGKQKQHLLWSAYDDEAELNRYKTHEFNVFEMRKRTLFFLRKL